MISKGDWGRINSELRGVLKYNLSDLAGDEGAVLLKRIEDLALIPNGMMAKLRRNGLVEVRFGRGGVANFEGYKHLARVRPLGYPMGTTFRDIAAAYDSKRHIVIVGSIEAGNGQPAVHEMMHALGDLIGYNEDSRLLAWAQKNSSELERLFPGHNAEGQRKEFFANMAQYAIMNVHGMLQYYGLQDFFLQTVLKMKKPQRW